MNFELKELLEKEENCINEVIKTKEPLAFLVEVIYKNGVVKEFWCKDFQLEEKNGGFSYEYRRISDIEKPLYLNPNDISSVWTKDLTIITNEDYKKYPGALAAYKEEFEK